METLMCVKAGRYCQCSGGEEKKNPSSLRSVSQTSMKGEITDNVLHRMELECETYRMNCLPVRVMKIRWMNGMTLLRKGLVSSTGQWKHRLVWTG